MPMRPRIIESADVATIWYPSLFIYFGNPREMRVSGIRIVYAERQARRGRMLRDGWARSQGAM